MKKLFLLFSLLLVLLVGLALGGGKRTNAQTQSLDVLCALDGSTSTSDDEFQLLVAYCQELGGVMLSTESGGAIAFTNEIGHLTGGQFLSGPTLVNQLGVAERPVLGSGSNLGPGLRWAIGEGDDPQPQWVSSNRAIVFMSDGCIKDTSPLSWRSLYQDFIFDPPGIYYRQVAYLELIEIGSGNGCEQANNSELKNKIGQFYFEFGEEPSADELMGMFRHGMLPPTDTPTATATQPPPTWTPTPDPGPTFDIHEDCQTFTLGLALEPPYEWEKIEARVSGVHGDSAYFEHNVTLTPEDQEVSITHVTPLEPTVKFQWIFARIFFPDGGLTVRNYYPDREFECEDLPTLTPTPTGTWVSPTPTATPGVTLTPPAVTPTTTPTVTPMAPTPEPPQCNKPDVYCIWITIGKKS